jgi:hypothetical protein
MAQVVLDSRVDKVRVSVVLTPVEFDARAVALTRIGAALRGAAEFTLVPREVV